jgi:hypothetical protein
VRLLLDECTPVGLIQLFVIVLIARTNRLADLEPLIKLAIKQAYEAKPGEVRHIQ